MTNVVMLEESTKIVNLHTKEKYQGEKAAVNYYGNEEQVTMKCHKRILDDVIDRFGLDIIVYDTTETHFTVTLKLVSQAALHFAQQYIPYCEIILPLNLREEMKLHLNEAQNLYQ